MPIESQNNFVGGLNNRFPAHKIPENSVQDAINCDFSNGDVRAIQGIGGDGGGSNFFYEAGNTWIGTDGVGGQTVEIRTFTTNTTLSSDATFGTPLIVNQNVVLTVNSGVTMTVSNVIRGLFGAQSFVEFSDDLYISRDDYSVSVPSIPANSIQLNVSASDIFKFIEGDELDSDFVNSDTKIKSINTASNIITLTKKTTNSGTLTNAVSVIKSTPVRIIDGNTSQILKLGIDTPKLGFTLGQLDTTQNSDRDDGKHSDNFFTNNAPVAFRYGIAKYDDATLAESGMSEPSDLSQSQNAIDTSKNNTPITVNFNQSRVCDITNANPTVITVNGHGLIVGDKVAFTVSSGGGLPTGLSEGTSYFVSSVPTSDTFQISTTFGGSSIGTTSAGTGTFTLLSNGPDDGKYSLYRIGGTSAIFKKAFNIFYKDTFNASATINSQTVTIAVSNLPATGTVYAIFYAYTGLTYTEGSTYSASDAHETKRLTLDASANNFKITSNTTIHKVDIILYIENTSETDDRVYRITGDLGASINIHGTAVTNAHVLDFTPDRNLIDIEPITDAGLPPSGLKHLTEVNNFLFGSKGKRLHISSYGRPNNWPLDGFLDFDANITALTPRGGECVVFTEFGIFRVYGNAHNAMRKVKVPTTEGVESGFFKCVANIKDNIVYKSQSGISIFNGRDVNVLTQPVLSSFSPPNATGINNSGGVLEDVYFLLSDSGEGFRIDFKFGNAKLSKTTLNAGNLYYRGLVNKLYTPDGFIGGGSNLTYSFQTRDFTLGNIDTEKYLEFVQVVGENFSGTVQIFADGSIVETFSISQVTELNRQLYPSTTLFANRFSVKFTNCTGNIQSVSLSINSSENLKRLRFDLIKVVYVGSPSVQVKVDNESKIAPTVLPDSGVNKSSTASLYFPAMTEGYIPHLIASSSETNKIITTELVAAEV